MLIQADNMIQYTKVRKYFSHLSERDFKLYSETLLLAYFKYLEPDQLSSWNKSEKDKTYRSIFSRYSILAASDSGLLRKENKLGSLLVLGIVFQSFNKYHRQGDH